jgi:hypothetical protein
VVSERLTTDARGRPRYGAAARSPKARPLHWSALAVSGDLDESPLEQTTSLGKKDAMPPSSPHAGSSVRTQYASPIPRSDAHNIVAANGQATRLLCGDGCRPTAVMAEIWFELDTGQDPDWRTMSSRPAIADRDGPGLLVRRVTPSARHRPNSRTSRDLLRAYSMLKGDGALPRQSTRGAP